MKNELVARILHEIADLLDLEGVAFKPRAYRRAAEVVEALAEPIEDLVADGTYAGLLGVGGACCYISDARDRGAIALGGT
jgi:DNA polymerase (family 10)